MIKRMGPTGRARPGPVTALMDDSSTTWLLALVRRARAWTQQMRAPVRRAEIEAALAADLEARSVSEAAIAADAATQALARARHGGRATTDTAPSGPTSSRTPPEPHAKRQP